MKTENQLKIVAATLVLLLAALAAIAFVNATEQSASAGAEAAVVEQSDDVAADDVPAGAGEDIVDEAEPSPEFKEVEKPDKSATDQPTHPAPANDDVPADPIDPADDSDSFFELPSEDDAGDAPSEPVPAPVPADDDAEEEAPAEPAPTPEPADDEDADEEDADEEDAGGEAPAEPAPEPAPADPPECDGVIVDGECVTILILCVTGYELIDQECVFIGCPDDLLLIDGLCQQPGLAPPCDDGFHYEDGECVADLGLANPQCEVGFYVKNGVCVPDPTHCIDGYKYVDGVCVLDALVLAPPCEAGEHLENGVCVPDVELGFALAAD